MDVVERTLRWQRIVLQVVVAAAALLFWRASYDVFNTVKATAIALGAITVVAIGAYRVARTRRLQVPRSPVLVGAGALAAALVVATAVSPLPVASIVGRPGRHTGLALYLTYLVLFAVAVRLYRAAAPTDLVRTLLGAAVPVALYGTLQAAGIDPLGWQAVEGGPQVFSTFGNANFMAAYLGVVVPLAAWGAITPTWDAPWRVASGVVGVWSLVVAYLSNSQQGPLMALAGTAFVAAVAVASATRVPRRVRALVLGGGAALGLVAVALVAAGVGPLGTVRANLAASLGTRTPKWTTALAIWRDHPVTGVGLERYADWFHAYRPADLAARTGLLRTTDTPHNIPLDMLANGGLLLAVAYLAFVGLTGWALVTGLRRRTGADRLLLAGIGGGWVAYQVQSLVSIDVPPVALLHYLLAGVIVGYGTVPALRAVALPGAPLLPAAAPGRPGRKRKAPPPAPPVVPVSPVLVGLIAVVALAAAVVATRPLRADTAAAWGARLAAAQPEAAAAAYRRAGELAPWESRYPVLEAGVLAATDPQAALAAYDRAAAADPRGLAVALNEARLAASAGDTERADAAWERVLAIDPTTPEVLASAGAYWLERGDVERARDLVDRGMAVADDDARLWVALGEVREAGRDTAGAREAFQRAIELDPEVRGAAEGLDRVNGVAAADPGPGG